MILQRTLRQYDDPLEKALVYYGVVCALNNIKLGNRELQLLAFTAVRGTITPKPAREEFARLFDSSLHTIENAKGVLVRKKLLIKDGEMYRVNPAILPPLDEDFYLLIRFDNGEDEKHESDGLPNKEDIQQARD